MAGEEAESPGPLEELVPYQMHLGEEEVGEAHSQEEEEEEEGLPCLVKEEGVGEVQGLQEEVVGVGEVRACLAVGGRRRKE